VKRRRPAGWRYKGLRATIVREITTRGGTTFRVGEQVVIVSMWRGRFELRGTDSTHPSGHKWVRNARLTDVALLDQIHTEASFDEQHAREE